MEALAFIHHADAYENPDRFQLAADFSFDEFMPGSAWLIVMGTATCLAVVSTPQEAIAQSVYQRGSRGPMVAEIQKVLNIPADGIYGPMTEAAVRDYQRRQQLDRVDGTVGTATLNALKLMNLNTPSARLVAANGQTRAATVMTPTGIGLNLRSAPNGAIVGGLRDGSEVSLTGREQVAGAFTWAELTNTRWVAKDYLRFTDASAATTFATAQTTQISTKANTGVVPTATVKTRTGVGLNLRNAPNGSIMGSVANGRTLQLTGNQQSAGAYLWSETTQGQWVASEFLQLDASATAVGAATTSAAATGDRTAIVSTNSGIGVNLRQAPNGEIIGSLPEGATITTTESEQSAGSYRWVQTPRGWVAKDFLRFTGATGGNTAIASQRLASPDTTADASPENQVIAAPTATPPGSPSAVAAQPNEPTAAPDAELPPENTVTPSPAPTAQSSPEAPDSEATAESPVAPDLEATAESPQPSPPSTESEPATEPDSERFVSGVDPRTFRGPEGTFPVKTEAERYSNPSGETIGAIAPSNTVTVTEQWALANGTVWAQLSDGTWIDSTALDLGEQP